MKPHSHPLMYAVLSSRWHHALILGALSCDPGRQGGGGNPAEEGVETLSELLGLLINLVEVSSANRVQLLDLDLEVMPVGGGRGASTGTEPLKMVPLLCRMIGGSSRYATHVVHVPGVSRWCKGPGCITLGCARGLLWGFIRVLSNIRVVGHRRYFPWWQRT